MTKFPIALTLVGSLLASSLPCLAADAKGTATAAPQGSASTAGGTTTWAHGDHPHYPHEWTPSKRDIMGLSDLTDKQRSDLAAIYSDSAPEYASIEMEYHDLRKKIWDKVQTVLTPAQADALRNQKRKARTPSGNQSSEVPLSDLDPKGSPDGSSK